MVLEWLRLVKRLALFGIIYNSTDSLVPNDITRIVCLR